MRWEEWMDGVLRERYADERNSVLIEELGVSERTLQRHAKALGLEKSAAFWKEVSLIGLREMAYLRACGKRVGGFRKGDGHKGTSGSFAKGHRFSPEVEAKRVKAIRDRAWDERVRMIRGWARKTGWKMGGDK